MSLNPGSVINEHFGYSNEGITVRRGLELFNTVAVAIVDPEQPSRDIPFILPSRQKGRRNLTFNLPAGLFITRAAVRIPKELTLAAETYQIGTALGDAMNISLPYVATALPGVFDYSVGWALADWQNFGQKVTEAQVETVPGNGVQSVATTNLAGGAILAECPIISDPTQANGDPLTAAWEPRFLMPGANPAPTTNNGRKYGIILDISGYKLNPRAIDTETALAGMGYLFE
jgi:hypothetical protein